MKIAIIDYGAGNLQSVANAIASLSFGDKITITKNKEDLRKASHIILPGVGAFGDCMNGLKAQEGLIEEIRYQAVVEQKPFLGICVGMQVLASIGHENGEHKGLGLIEGEVVKLKNDSKANLKIPQMGWNSLIIKDQKHFLLKSIKEGDHVYFANSYHFLCQNQESVVAQVEYGVKINAIIAKRNITGVQFHPEKSGETGLQIIKNFLDWRYNTISNFKLG